MYVHASELNPYVSINLSPIDIYWYSYKNNLALINLLMHVAWFKKIAWFKVQKIALNVCQIKRCLAACLWSPFALGWNGSLLVSDHCHFQYEISDNSFLLLWTFHSVQGSNGTEIHPYSVGLEYQSIGFWPIKQKNENFSKVFFYVDYLSFFLLFPQKQLIFYYTSHTVDPTSCSGVLTREIQWGILWRI